MLGQRHPAAVAPGIGRGDSQHLGIRLAAPQRLHRVELRDRCAVAGHHNGLIAQVLGHDRVRLRADHAAQVFLFADRLAGTRGADKLLIEHAPQGGRITVDLGRGPVELELAQLLFRLASRWRCERERPGSKAARADPA